MAALIFLDRNEDFTIAAPEKDLRDMPGGHLPQLAFRLRGVSDRPAIDGEDDVAGLDSAGRRAVRINIGDERPRPARWHLKLPRCLRREILQRQPEAARGLFRLWLVVVVPPPGARRLFRVEVELLNGDVEGLFLPVPHHLEWHGRAWLGGDDHLHEIVALLHRPGVVLDDDVARLDAGLGRRGAGRHLRHERTPPRFEAEFRVVLARDGDDRDADASADYLSLTQLRQQFA